MYFGSVQKGVPVAIVKILKANKVEYLYFLIMFFCFINYNIASNNLEKTKYATIILYLSVINWKEKAPAKKPANISIRGEFLVK